MAIYRLNQKIAGQVSSYPALSDKPSINSVSLTGNQTSDDIGVLGNQYAAAQDGYIAKVDSADHKLKVMPASTTSVTFADITGQPTDNTNLATALAGKQATLTFDSTPTALSTNPVTSNGVYVATIKRIQYGTSTPDTGFSGTPVAGDIYVKYTP